MFRRLLERVKVLTTYGSHDNLEVLQRLGIPMKDEEVYEYRELRIASINGIVSTRKRAGDSILRNAPEEFASIARKLQRREDRHSTNV